MRRLLVALSALACACDGSSFDGPDAGGTGGDDAAVDPDDGGATNHPRTITLTLNNRPMNAAKYSFFVAYQDGSAPWAAAPAPSGDTYTFEVSAPSYGVAFGCIANTSSTSSTQLRAITTAHFAVLERTEVAFDVPARCSDRAPASVALSGTVTNRPWGGYYLVQFGDRQAFVSSQSGNFSLQTPPGTRDLIVARALPQGNGEYYVDGALVIRDLAVTASTTRTLDFSGARQTVAYPVNVGVSEARVATSTTLYTDNGTTLDLVREVFGARTESLATSQMRASDVYDQAITVSIPGRSVTVTNATSTPAAQTFVPPPLLGAASASVIGKAPYPIVGVTWPAYADAVGYTWNGFQQLYGQDCGFNGGCTVTWTAHLSPGVTGAMPGYEMPDLADVPGFEPAFAFVGGEQIRGSVTAQTSSAGAGDFPPGIPASGTERVFVRSDYGITP